MKTLTEKEKGRLFFIGVLVVFVVLSMLVVLTGSGAVVDPSTTPNPDVYDNYVPIHW